MTYVDTTERVGDLILQVVNDEMAGTYSPRTDQDNLSHIYGKHRSYDIGDGEPPTDEMRALERGGITLLYRWLRRCKGVVAFTKLGMIDHSGVSFYAVPLGSSATHPMDYGGWDSGPVGYAYVDRAGLEDMGTDEADAERIMLAEIEEYNDWSQGNVWGFVVTKPCDHADQHVSDEDIARCPHAENVESVWGFIGDPEYALTEGRATAGWYSANPTVSQP